MRRDLETGRWILDGMDQWELEELARKTFIDKAAFASSGELWLNVILDFMTSPERAERSETLFYKFSDRQKGSDNSSKQGEES